MPQTEPVWNNNIITSNMQNHGQCCQYSILLVQSRLVNIIQEGRQPRVIGWRMKKSPMKLVMRTTLNLSLQAKISLIYINQQTNHHEVPRWRLTYESLICSRKTPQEWQAQDGNFYRRWTKNFINQCHQASKWGVIRH